MAWIALVIMITAIAFFAWVLCRAASDGDKLLFDKLDGNDEDEE